MAKSSIKGDITEAAKGVQEIMQEYLAGLGDSLIEKIMRKYRAATASTQVNAYKDVEPTGVGEYKNALKETLAIISKEAINNAKKEVPKKKGLRLALEDSDDLTLSEFDGLPPKVKKKVQAQADLLVGSQVEDLKKAVYFQYQSSIERSDSEATIASDLQDAAEELINGPAIVSGAAVVAAKAVNTARSAFFFDDAVLGEIEAFQFVNGDPVTDICQELAGRIFAKDDPDLDTYQPPLHWNCKSYIVPILKLGDKEIDGAPALSKKAQGQIKFSECPSCKHF